MNRMLLRMMATAPTACKEVPYTGRVSPSLTKKWDSVQNEMQKKIIFRDIEPWQSSDELSGLTRIAGVDISVPTSDHSADECDAVAAVVICQYPDLKIIHEETQQVRLTVPYVPGYLAFREASAVIELIQRIVQNHPDKVPDVMLVDGNGLLHPHRCGLACHVGVSTGIPTVGVAKNLHLLEGIDVTRHAVQGMAVTGDYVFINDASNKTLGMALKTAADAKNPIYISIGHKISLETARRVVLKCCKYRIPDPIRFADNISRELVRKMENKSQSEVS